MKERIGNKLKPVRVPSRVTFVRDAKLMERRAQARAAVVASGKNVDRPREPIDYDRSPPPV